MTDRRPDRYDTLDAWRGLACAAVIVFHAVVAGVAKPEFVARMGAEGGSVADWLVLAAARLWVGVPVFFVISGYCIAAAAESARRHPHPARRFFTRRFRRIYPPLWAFLALTAVAVTVSPIVMPFHPPGRFTAWQWAGSLTLTEEWRPHLVGSPRDYFVGHIWTLCYEEQFYVVVGLIVAVAPRRLFPAVAVVTVVVALKVVGTIRLPFPTYGFFFDGLWLAFAAGVGVYYRAHRATASGRLCVDVALLVGAMWAVANIPDRWEFSQTLPASLAVACPTAAVLGWLHRFDTRTATLRLLAPLRWCGVRCYSLYLVHGPITSTLSLNLHMLGVTGSAETLLLTVPLCLGASAAGAWVFHRWVETQFLNAPGSARANPKAWPPLVPLRKCNPPLHVQGRCLPLVSPPRQPGT